MCLFALHPHYPTPHTNTLASPQKRGGGLQTSERLENSALLCDISNAGIFAIILSARRWGLIPISTINEIFRTIPRPTPTHLPPLLKVRCCRPKKFGRLPEGLHNIPSPRITFQNRTIPLTFRNANICMCLFALHPHYPTPHTNTLASPQKRGGGLQTSERLENSALLCDISNAGIFAIILSARRWGLIPISTINEIFRNIPRPTPTPLPTLSKVRCCRPKKFGRLPEGLSLHQPSQNRTIPRKSTISFPTPTFSHALDILPFQ